MGVRGRKCGAQRMLAQSVERKVWGAKYGSAKYGGAKYRDAKYRGAKYV